MVDTGSNSNSAAPEFEQERSSSSEDLTLWKGGTDEVQSTEDALVGSVIGERYRIDGVLGEGGMGRVYKATHIHMHKEVALKVLRPEMTVVPGVLARFEREAIAAGRISHPNVVAATDFGRIAGDGAFYLVLEYVNGRNLRHELKYGAFTVPRAVRVALQICEALVAAHQRGVIHRDLKPDNIMLVDNGGVDLVKVLDFGIAKLNDPAVESDNHKTRMGLVMGTPRYMSPEQGAGAPVDHRTDLYSLGVIMYEMLAGHPPFSGGGVEAILSQHLAVSPPPLPGHIDAAVSKLVFELLQKVPNARPASANDVLLSLRRLRHDTVRPHGLILVEYRIIKTWRAFVARVSRVYARVFDDLLPVWRRATARLPWLVHFERRVRLGQHSVSIPALVGGILVVTLAAWLWTNKEQELPVAPIAENHAPAEDLPVAAPSGGEGLTPREELDDLLAVPVYKRSREQWLAIASAHADFQEWKQSVAAYRNALQLDPKLKDDGRLVQRLRDVAEIPEVYDAVANIALNLLGEAGMDLMYDLWLEVRNDQAQSVIAASALKSLGIFRLKSASRALRVPLALQFIKPEECIEIAKVLTDALSYADERAVPMLVKLRETTGCGASKKRDCYACLRPREKELDAAIERAESRRAPRFDGQRYVPAN